MGDSPRCFACGRFVSLGEGKTLVVHRNEVGRGRMSGGDHDPVHFHESCTDKERLESHSWVDRVEVV